MPNISDAVTLDGKLFQMRGAVKVVMAVDHH